jgi:hypothetical protein
MRVTKDDRAAAGPGADGACGMTAAEKMARARAKVRPGRRAHDHQTQLARTLALPSISELGLSADQREEQVLSLAQAADLLEVSFQAVAQAVLRGSLAAYRDGRRRVVLADDLAETRTARAQVAAEAEHDRLVFWSKDRHENPMPEWMTGGPVICPSWCLYPGCQDTLAVGASDD